MFHLLKKALFAAPIQVEVPTQQAAVVQAYSGFAGWCVFRECDDAMLEALSTTFTGTAHSGWIWAIEAERRRRKVERN